MVSVEYRRHRSHFFRKHAHVQLGVALLDHAAQKRRRIDSPLGFVNGAAIAPHFGHMAGHALVFCDQLLTEFDVSFLENRRLRHGCACQCPTQTQPTQNLDEFHSSFPIKKPLKARTLSGKQKPRVPIELWVYPFEQASWACDYLPPAKIQVAKVRASASLKAA